MGSGWVPLIYLLTLLGILSWVAFQVVQQVLRTRSYEMLISKLQPRLARGTGTPEEHYELGCAYLEKKLYEEAIRQFKKAIDLDPKYAEAHNNLGYAYFQQKQWELALRSYREATKHKEGYIPALSNLANLYEKKSQSALALECYEKILALEPKHDLALRRVGILRKLVPATEP